MKMIKIIIKAIKEVNEESKIEKLLNNGYTKIYYKNKLTELYNGTTGKTYKVKYSR